MAFRCAPVILAAMALLVGVSPAAAVSFIGCDKKPNQVAKGSHSGWKICQTRLPIADVRGRGEKFGRTAAISGSHEYVILKVHGSRLDILQRAERVMRRLVMVGYPKLGIVLSDGPNPTVMEVYSGGRRSSYDVLRNVDAIDGELGIREVVTEAYVKNIGPRQQK